VANRRNMQIYIFNSVRNSSVRAFTSDCTAGNLPIAYAPWQSSSTDTALPTWGLADPVVVAIERDGFFLVNTRHPSKPVLTTGQRTASCQQTWIPDWAGW
jgi:hypothetical protein